MCHGYVPILLSEVEQEQRPSGNEDREAIIVGAGLCDGEGERAYTGYAHISVFRFYSVGSQAVELSGSCLKDVQLLEFNNPVCREKLLDHLKPICRILQSVFYKLNLIRYIYGWCCLSGWVRVFYTYLSSFLPFRFSVTAGSAIFIVTIFVIAHFEKVMNVNVVFTSSNARSQSNIAFEVLCSKDSRKQCRLRNHVSHVSVDLYQANSSTAADENHRTCMS